MKRRLVVFLFILSAILHANTAPTVNNMITQQIVVNGFYDFVTQLSSPQNISIEVNGNDVILTWDPVTTDINGVPMGATYCYYNIYCDETPNIDINNINIFIGRTILTEFTHESATNGDKLFYTITATRHSTVTDVDGNVYQTLVIGNQEWMIENLKVTHYQNGDPIPNVTDGSTWGGLSSGAYCYYNNSSANGDIYGALYNWYAVNDSRGLAPAGWHVPSDNEIKELEMYLGMSPNQVNRIGLRGTNEGSKLAGNYDLWSNGVLRNDPEFGSSGFSFLPGGNRYWSDGAFYSIGSYGYLGSSTESQVSSAWTRSLSYLSSTVYRSDGSNKRNGLSVRCIRSIE